jgi:hypothetical protein
MGRKRTRYGGRRGSNGPSRGFRAAVVASQLLTISSGWAESEKKKPGDAPADERTPAVAVQQSQSPVPTTTQLEFEPEYTFPNGQSRYIAQLVFEPILPYDGVLIPGLNVKGFRSVARLQIAGQSMEQLTPMGPLSASGLTDLNFVDGVVHEFGPLFEGALGFGTVFPMATNPALGQGKWQLGPVALLEFMPVPELQIGAIVQALWSVAGDSQRQTLAYATIQPVVSLLLPGNCTLFTDDTMAFYWAGSGTTVPISLGFGHGFSEHFVGQLEGVYTVSGSGQRNMQGVLILNFQP